jgi:hypothetical protein
MAEIILLVKGYNFRITSYPPSSGEFDLEFVVLNPPGSKINLNNP